MQTTPALPIISRRIMLPQLTSQHLTSCPVMSPHTTSCHLHEKSHEVTQATRKESQQSSLPPSSGFFSDLLTAASLAWSWPIFMRCLWGSSAPSSPNTRITWHTHTYIIKCQHLTHTHTHHQHQHLTHTITNINTPLHHHHTDCSSNETTKKCNCSVTTMADLPWKRDQNILWENSICNSGQPCTTMDSHVHTHTRIC